MSSQILLKKMGSKKPYLVAILTQIFLAGMSIVSKAAFASGMNSFVFVFYRQAAGAVFFLPLILFLKRKESTRSLSLRDFLKIFVISLIGMTIGFNAYGVAVDYTSANLGAAAFNCLPVTTFLFALLLRMEKVNIRTVGGMAKTFGILICIGGVMTLAFYKGPYLKPLINHHFFQFHKTQTHHHDSSSKTWIIGCFLLFIASISWGLWFVLQAHFLKSYPSPLEFISYQTLLSTAQSFVIAIAMERNPSEWKLGWNIRLLAVLYCGIVVTFVSNFLQCWVIKEKGPVFQAMTTPLNVVSTIIGSELFLADGIHLGSLIGAMLLVVSLYSVLWGKSKELSIIIDTNNSNQSAEPKDLPQMIMRSPPQP